MRSSRKLNEDISDLIVSQKIITATSFMPSKHTKDLGDELQSI